MDCADETECRLRSAFSQAYEARLEVLERVSIADARAVGGDVDGAAKVAAGKSPVRLATTGAIPEI